MADNTSTDSQRQELADAFGRTLDPLGEFESTFAELDIDPFELFMEDVVLPSNPTESTASYYRTAFRDWYEFMAEQNRHPACPNEEHVKQFLKREINYRGHKPGTAKKKLQKLSRAYEYWQADPSFPHPEDYNPFKVGREKVNLKESDKKPYPRLTVDNLREKIHKQTHIRDRAIVVLQLKLGLRASEVGNIKLSETHISNRELQKHYPEMGTHPMLDGRENAIYIPHDRDKNKSDRPRVLPLDDETRQVLLRHLLIRPDDGEPWLFLGKQENEKAGRRAVLDAWKATFHPEYEETEETRPIKSHYGRHFFTTYWGIEKDLNRELVKYMRGDKTSNTAPNGREAIDEYLHTYYEDIEPLYREEIFKLGV